MLYQGVPDITTVIHDQTASGDKVWTFKTFSGTHSGELWGIPPTGRTVSFRVIDIMTVRGGRITDHSGVAEFGALLAELRGLSGT